MGEREKAVLARWSGPLVVTPAEFDGSQARSRPSGISAVYSSMSPSKCVTVGVTVCVCNKNLGPLGPLRT